MKEDFPRPLYSGAAPDQVAEDISKLVDFQHKGMQLDELRSLLSEYLLPHLMHYDRPQFQSMFNAFPPPEAKLGGQVMLDYNQGVTSWEVSPGGAVLEELCCQALCRLFGLNPEADATFMYSGTYANQQAVYMAIHRFAERQGFDLAKRGISGFKDPARLALLVSEDAHFSLKHAVRVLGLGDDSLVLLPVDANRRIDIHALRRTISDISASRDIFCMVASAGTTSTGSVDPIEEMVELCAEIGAWLHVDGAYGYAYKLVPDWAHKFAGDTRAESILWDPHKQIGAPIPSSLLFVKNRDEFQRMALHSHYFNRKEDAVPNPGIKSMPSTRPMSALPLVTILRGQGIDRVVEDLRSPLSAVRMLADKLNNDRDVEVMHEPDTGILCFRMTPDGVLDPDLDSLQLRLYQQVLSSGERSISLTKLDGKTVLRLVVVSPHTKLKDLLETIDFLRRSCEQQSY